MYSYTREEMGPVQGVGSRWLWAVMGRICQFYADKGLDWTDVCVRASNERPSKPFSYIYSTYFLTVKNI